MSFEMVGSPGKNYSNSSACSRGLQRCFGLLVNIRDKKILLAAHGVFVFSLGIVLIVGYFAIRATTTSNIHRETPTLTIVSSVMVILTGALFTSLVILKERYLVISSILLCSASGILSAIGAVHYGIAVAERISALSGCRYTTVLRLCTCSVETKMSKVMYNFENTASCSDVTTHLREVVYGMVGVYSVTFVACFGAAIYGILHLHKIEIKKIKSKQRDMKITKKPLEEKLGSEEDPPEILPASARKCGLPWQQDVATQTSDQERQSQAGCRHQCRHFVGLTVPESNNDYVVNITKTRDPPPPYCETVFT